MQLLIFLLFVIPFPLIQGYPLARRDRQNPYPLLYSWISGWLLLYASILPLALAGIFLERSLKELLLVWGGVAILFFLFSARLILKDRGGFFAGTLDRLKLLTVPEVLAVLPVAAHAVCTAVLLHEDHDDVAYVAAATTSVDTNTLMRFDAVTGNLITDLAKNEMNRLVTAPQFAFYAAVSKLTRIRPARLCHTWLPPVFTLLFFAALALVGARLLEGDRRKTGWFVLASYAVCAWSYVSTHTAGTVILVRSWQGKAQFVGLITPVLLAFMLGVLERKRAALADVLELTLIFSACCLLTTMGTALAAVFAGVLAVAAALLSKQPSIFLRLLPAFLVPAAAVLLYLRI